MFDKLPPEIIICIAWSVDTVRDFSALSRTCRQAHVLLSELLYRYDVQHSNSSALRWAAKNLNEIIYRKARDAGAVIHLVYEPVCDPGCDGILDYRPDYTWSHALHYAAALGREGMVDLLLATEGIFDVPNPGWTLVRAARGGHYRIVDRLLKTGKYDANMTTSLSGLGALHHSARDGHVLVIEALLRHDGIDVNIRGEFGNWTPLMCAADSGQELSVRALLAADGLDMDAQDSTGRTALFWACAVVTKNEHVKRPAIETVAEGEALANSEQQAKKLVVVKALCNAGASIFIADEQGETPLHQAIKSDFTDIVSFLAAKPGACDVKDNAGYTPLSYAASLGKANMVEVLRQHSASDARAHGRTNAQGLEDSSIFSHEKGSAPVVDILLNFDPSHIHDTDPDGLTLFQMAEKAKNQGILRLLRRHARRFSRGTRC